MGDTAERRRIKQAIAEALEEVYRCVAIQGSLNDKQKKLIDLSVQKILGEEEKTPKVDNFITKMEDGKTIFICKQCGKRCNSSSGLTLHLKRHAKA